MVAPPVRLHLQHSETQRGDAHKSAGRDRPERIAPAEHHERSGRQTDDDRQRVVIGGPHHGNAAGQDQTEGERYQALLEQADPAIDQRVTIRPPAASSVRTAVKAIASCGWSRYAALTVQAEEVLRVNESIHG
jgi:hypothetical protein